MRSRAQPALSARLPVWRARVLVLLLFAGFMTLAARALYLQGLNKDFLQARGESRYERTIAAVANRGTITDRNGDPLAISTPVESVWASPRNAELSASQRGKLARMLGMSRKELDRRLSGEEREFVYLKRQLPPKLAAEVVAQNLPGVFLQREYRRYYPAGDVAAHVIGFTSVDDRGQEGIELAYQEWLAGKPGSRRVIKDRLGRIVEDVERNSAAEDGRPLALSIDRKIQYLAYRELKRAAIEHSAKAASIVVLDVASGEVLALANWPSYNPNNRDTFKARRTRNRAVVDLFEPGSTIKPFTAAAAIEAGLFNPATTIDIEAGRLRIGNRTIHDVHVDQPILTVSQVIQKSSNVGSAKIALSMEAQDLWQVFTLAGFGATPKSGFPGEASGLVRDFDDWKPIEQATMSYGHGISVSLLQLARAYTVFASDGILAPLTFVRRDAPVPGQRVISERTARLVRAMLESVTHPGGTAVKARVTGYRVAGKTGTVHKLVDGRYAPDRYMSSFVGFAPASNPRLVVAVMIDEPSGVHYYGGEVAAPVFREVTAGALRILGISPDGVNDIVPLNVELPREEV
ncbi:MAG: cell division protein [Betaproteobacteria bacterium SG8_40]|jgi:cell division protein FtsI (penicillin-binding protein 3)|nr:MAG: cell division protein [Betaproteobacteria bacterium SG8_40]